MINYPTFSEQLGFVIWGTTFGRTAKLLLELTFPNIKPVNKIISVMLSVGLGGLLGQNIARRLGFMGIVVLPLMITGFVDDEVAMAALGKK